MNRCFFEKIYTTFILIGKKVISMIKKAADKILSGLAEVKYRLDAHVNTRAKRIAVRTAAAFCAGAVVCCIIVAASNNMKTENGIGGLETTGVPEFSDSLLGKADNELDAAADVLSKDAGKVSSLYYQTYRVRQGDMIGIIADEYGVTQDTIISVNSIRQSRLLQVGQYLKIPSMPGILYTVKNDGETPETIAEKYEISADKCAKVNSVKKDAPLDAGVTIFVPDAQLDWVTRQEINGDLFIKPVKIRYWLSSPYGWRQSPFTGQRSFHTGIDMACPIGTNVYAALSGKVSSTGYSATYGNYIIISHHSGYKTLYGHLSAILVVPGQNVDTNTRIGRVGNTGLSTGPHLHFTVFKAGKTVNPLTLLK
ncbi:MAG: M23 family metallopeptidase [Treponema sp.]|nr:M23 family metallopeptidase [Treponema sp.]